VGTAPNRLNVPDARGDGASLRVTRHAKQHRVVLSHWRNDVCVASTPVELTELPALIGVLVDALGDAVASPDSDLVSSPKKSSPWSKLRSRFRPALAKVVDLPVRRGQSPERTDQRAAP
jgi:hypothetical protein